MEYYYEVIIQKSHRELGKYQVSPDRGEPWLKEGDLVDNMYCNDFALFELGVDILPDEIEDIRGRIIHNKPYRVFGYRERGQTRYIGIVREIVMEDIKKMIISWAMDTIPLSLYVSMDNDYKPREDWRGSEINPETGREIHLLCQTGIGCIYGELLPGDAIDEADYIISHTNDDKDDAVYDLLDRIFGSHKEWPDNCVQCFLTYKEPVVHKIKLKNTRSI